MKFYLALIALSLCIERSRGAAVCSKDEGNVTVMWQCGKEHDEVNCSTLNDALDYSTHQTANCPRKTLIRVKVLLNSPNMSLSCRQRNTITFDDSVSSFSLSGKNTSIECNHQCSMHFNKTNVEISNVSLIKCGNGISTLSFLDCNVSMLHVVVADSNGSGLHFEGISSYANVSHSVFHDNKVVGRFGAGVSIIFSSQQLQQSINIVFSHCHFLRNHAFNKHAFVSGGAMSIRIEGYTHNVKITIHKSIFNNNTAEWGSGLYCSFGGHAKKNSITIHNTTFENNYYPNKHIDLYNAGGGALVTTVESSRKNNITFSKCRFYNNSATWGGALAWYARPNNYLLGFNKLNQYILANSIFEENKATVGSVMSIYCMTAPKSPGFCNAIPSIVGYSVFKNNGQSITVSDPSSTTESTLQINGFFTYINGTLIFRDNFGTPIFVRNTAVLITSKAHLVFKNNSAETGGGIALYDSWITVSNGSRLDFTNNTALMDGGAIYAHQSADLYVPHAHSCFIRYSNANTLPWKWESKFTFNGNKASNRNNSIYATSIIPCAWNHPNSTKFNMMEIFCNWSRWKFENPENCSENILTSVRNFSKTPSMIHVSPGIPKKFVVGVDDLGHKIPKLSVVPTVWPQNNYNISVQYTDDGLVVYGKRYSGPTTILLQVYGDRSIFKKVRVFIDGCPPGFEYLPNSLSCKCDENNRNFLLCDGRNWSALLFKGFCMSFSKIHNITQTVYGRCVFSNSPTVNLTTVYIPLPQYEDDLDKRFCGLFHRTGLLCGRCLKNYSIDVFSTTYDCHKCSPSAASWIIFFTVALLPPLVLFLLILALHISFTGGSMNAFIFFSQVVTLSQEVMLVVAVTGMKGKLGTFMLRSVVDLYSVWSLDNYRIIHSFMGYHHPICLGERLGVIEVLTLRYVSALYPFLLIAVAYVVIELHARNCRVFVCLWKPLCFLCTRFRRSWKLKTSVVDAFATFMILSYVKLIRMSLLLVTFTNVMGFRTDLKLVKRVTNYDPTIDYLSHNHVPYVLLGSFFLVTFGILPPLLLVTYQFQMVQRCLTQCRMNRLCLKTFMDAFQGCYRDGRNGGPDRRFFAGLYLVFRVVIFVAFNLQTEHINTYYILVLTCIFILMLIAWLRPYKVMFYNHLDVFIMGILATFFGLHVVGFYYLETSIEVPTSIILIALCLCFIPLSYMVGLVIFRIFRRCYRLPIAKSLHRRIHAITEQRHKYREESPLLSVTHSEVSLHPNDAIPDRLVHPDAYPSNP